MDNFPNPPSAGQTSPYHNRPLWLIRGLGGLLMIFLVLLIVQKGYDLNQTFKNSKPNNTISVSGEGKVTATPDLATVTLGLFSQGSDAITVKNQNNDKVNKIIAFVKGLGVDSKDVSTSDYNLYPQYNYAGGQQAITGYQVRQTITIKIHGVDKNTSQVDKILDGAVNNGANEVDGVSLSIEKPQDLQQNARKLAIDDAKAKAQGLASEAGLTLGKVVSVSESSAGYPGPIPYAMGMASGMGGGGGDKSVAPNIQAGSQDVVENMTVVFEIK